MVSKRNDHCHLNPYTPANPAGAFSADPYSFYYFYACQAMLEVRSSGE